MNMICEKIKSIKDLVARNVKHRLQKLGWIVIRTNDVYGLIGHYKEQGNEERYHLTNAQKKWLETNYESFNDLKRESVDEMFEWDK